MGRIVPMTVVYELLPVDRPRQVVIDKRWSKHVRTEKNTYAKKLKQSMQSVWMSQLARNEES